MTKKLSLLLLLLVLTLSVILACESGKDGTDGTTVGITDPVTDGITDAATTEGVTEAETEPPVTLEGENGETLTGNGVYGWFDYGTALYMRDTFKVGTRDSIAFGMAKNEIEGFQYLLASPADHQDLRCEVSALTDGNGNSLEGTVFIAQQVNVRKTDDIHKLGFYPDALLEQDNPYHGGTFDLRAGRSRTLYVQYKTDVNTVPGTYTGTLEIKQGDTVVLSGTVSVTVYDLYYDEKTECLSYFQWGPRCEEWNRFENGIPNIYHDHPELYAAYCDILIDNRMSPMNLPHANLNDEGADAYMDNPRVNTVMLRYSYDNLDALADQYRLATEKGWLDKIVFLSFDEPSSDAHFANILNAVSISNAYFPSTHHVNAFFCDIPSGGRNIVERFSDFSTMHCIKSSAVDGLPEAFRSMRSLKENRGDILFWYVCGKQGGNYINLLPCTDGTAKRVLFWQQYLYDIDGFHYWHTNNWLAYFNIWEEGYEDKKQKPIAATGAYTGDGCLVYWDPNTYQPIGSLGLEATRDGIEDFQLLRMAERVLGKETVMAYTERLTTSLTEYTTDAALLAQVKAELSVALEAALAP